MWHTNPVTGMRVGEVEPADFLRGNETSSKESRSSKEYESHASSPPDRNCWIVPQMETH